MDLQGTKRKAKEWGNDDSRNKLMAALFVDLLELCHRQLYSIFSRIFVPDAFRYDTRWLNWRCQQKRQQTSPQTARY